MDLTHQSAKNVTHLYLGIYYVGGNNACSREQVLWSNMHYAVIEDVRKLNHTYYLLIALHTVSCAIFMHSVSD